MHLSKLSNISIMLLLPCSRFLLFVFVILLSLFTLVCIFVLLEPPYTLCSEEMHRALLFWWTHLFFCKCCVHHLIRNQDFQQVRVFVSDAETLLTLLLLLGKPLLAIMFHTFLHTCLLIHLFPLVWAPTFCFLPTVLVLRPTCSWVEMSGWAGTVSHFLFPVCLCAFGWLPPQSMSGAVCSQTGKRRSSGFHHVL